MSEYVYLQGSQDVERAGTSIRQSAQEMSNAASAIDQSLCRNQQFMSDWMNRFEAAIECLKVSTEPRAGEMGKGQK